jgi:TRAP-type mannitol/chloroaromatic compound transport system permease small subunit
VRNTFLKVYDGYAKLQIIFALLAGICTFFIMLLIVANALLRKTINVPVPAAVEITQALLVAVIMLPFAYTQVRREHVNTVLFTQQMSRSTRRALHVFWLICGFLLFLAVTYGTFQYGMRSYRMGEQTWGATIQFPVWPSKIAVSVGTLLLAIQFLLDAIHALLINDDRAVDPDPIESLAHV